jgi:hypothetical protein
MSRWMRSSRLRGVGANGSERTHLCSDGELLRVCGEEVAALRWQAEVSARASHMVHGSSSRLRATDDGRTGTIAAVSAVALLEGFKVPDVVYRAAYVPVACAASGCRWFPGAERDRQLEPNIRVGGCAGAARLLPSCGAARPTTLPITVAQGGSTAGG